MDGRGGRHREHRRLTLPEQRPHGVFGRAPAGAGSLRQSDRHVDRDDGGLFRRVEHIDEPRHHRDPHAVALRAGERRDPRAAATGDAGKPSHGRRPTGGGAAVTASRARVISRPIPPSGPIMTTSSDRPAGSVDPKLLEILVCPVTKSTLEYDADKQELISRAAKLAYPIRDGIPIMLPEEARPLE